MSLRPNARTEVRRNRYKVAVDAEEGRRRREDNMVEIRKNRREESLMKKRREGMQAQQLPVPMSSSAMEKKLESLPAMVSGVYSNENHIQLEATTQFRKLLSIERSPPIEEVINSGVVPKFVEFLMREDFPQLQFEAAWALTNIASGTSENTKVVIDHEAVPIFVKLLGSPSDDVREQAVWALGNVAGDSPKYRDLVLGHGALQPLLAQLNEHTKLSTLRNATWTLSNLCRGKHQSLFEQVKPALERLIDSSDKEVLTDACGARSYLSDGTNDTIQAVIEAGVCPHLVELLMHPSPSVSIPALRTVGNNVTGDDLRTQVEDVVKAIIIPDIFQEGFGTTTIHVSRPKDVEEQRSSLPIIMMEQEIMETISENSVVIICGETGCGKTTQVPQFLYEAGFGSDNSTTKKGIIGITQPRRVAVFATAKRVSYELGLCLGKEVGFQVRHDKMLGEKCSIKFMTDGILMRELQSDFLLKKYSVIILDEAHERSLNTDILIGMLSRIIHIRQKIYLEQQEKINSGIKVKPDDIISPLRLVLMSATLRVEDFISDRKLFSKPPPVIEVPTRQYPVTIHFSKKTNVMDYVGQAYKKVLQIHKRLPPGGILVFVTGQREIEYLCKKLRKASQQFEFNNKENLLEKALTGEIDTEVVEQHINSCLDEVDIFERFEQDQDNPENDSYSSESDSDIKLDDDNVGRKPSMSQARTEEHIEQSVGPLHILPLYARLSASAQLCVFDNAPEGERLVVVATNVAETSLTIPGIRYVVDTGKEKVKNYNHVNGMEAYEIQWISKASAAQRAGRAGRTGPGHCYRLYSSAAFGNLFADFSCPQITKIPVEGVTLFMKFMGINKVANFPFPTSPDAKALVEADRCLKAVSALDNDGKLTEIGKAMARFPMSPRHSRMLLTVIQLVKSQLASDRANFLLAYGVACAATLSFPNPFNMQLDIEGKSNELRQDQTPDIQKGKQRVKQLKAMAREVRSQFYNPTSDALTISHALHLFELTENQVEFCRNNLLHYKTMDEISKLRKQILQLIFFQSELYPEFHWTHGSIKDVEHIWKSHCANNPLQMYEEEILGQAICAGWADRVAKQIHGVSKLSETDLKARAVRYQSCALKETVFLHRWSSVSQTAPEFVVYTELIQSKRPYMHGVTAIKPCWLVKYSSSLCSFSTPLVDPRPYYDPLKDEVLCWISPTFGPHLWQLPLHSLPIKDTLLRVSVFACALLEGNVVPCLKSTQKFMAASPASILRPEASGQRRVGDLLSRLRKGSRIIDSRAALHDTWKENPSALYSELRNWFQEKFQGTFEIFWNKMQLEVACAAHELYPKKNTTKKKKVTRLR